MKQKIYEITIEQVENGYTVKVGCKRFVFGSVAELLTELHDYLENPAAKHGEHGVGPYGTPLVIRTHDSSLGTLAPD